MYSCMSMRNSWNDPRPYSVPIQRLFSVLSDCLTLWIQVAKYSSHVTSMIKRSRPYFYTDSSWGTAAEWKLWVCMCVWRCLEECHERESLTLTQIGLLYRCQDPDSTQHNTCSHQETCYMSKARSFVTVLQFSVLASNHKGSNREGK